MPLQQIQLTEQCMTPQDTLSTKCRCSMQESPHACLTGLSVICQHLRRHVHRGNRFRVQRVFWATEPFRLSRRSQSILRIPELPSIRNMYTLADTNNHLKTR